MAVVLEQSLPFRITVLEGPGAPIPIDLAGRALPYRGVAWETEQRVKTTYYPGNPVATQQILGPMDKPTTIGGIWKDIFLGNGVAKRLVDTFDGICRSGFQVELSWGQGLLPDGSQIVGPKWPIVRQGVIKTFKHTYDRPQDITWEIVFELRGRDEASAPPLTAAGLISVQDGFDALKIQFGDSEAGIEAFKESTLSQLAGINADIEARLDEAQESVLNMIEFINDSTQAVQDVAEFGTLPNNVLERGRSLAAQGASSLGALTDAMLSINVALFTPVDSALVLLDVLTQFFDITHQNDEAQETANNTDAALAKQIRPEVLAELRPVPGSDLRDVARQYYGNPDLWYVIADFNNLSSSVVPFPPDGPSDNTFPTIKIPQRPQGLQGAARPAC